MLHYGIDTSIFVRLLTSDPEVDYAMVLERLKKLHATQPAAEIFVSNQVIGEAYITLQHHYGVSKADARSAISSVFESGLVSPLNGSQALAAIAESSGCGLMDRLITDDYHQRGFVTLTLDRRMAKLPGAQAL